MDFAAPLQVAMVDVALVQCGGAVLLYFLPDAAGHVVVGAAARCGAACAYISSYPHTRAERLWSSFAPALCTTEGHVVSP